jgi:hypothetical protein
MKLRQSYRMIRYPIILLIIIPVLTLTCEPTHKPETNVEGYRILESYRQLHVLKNGRHMATYLYDSVFLKPVLYPVYSASGIMIQRRYPFSVEEGESHDHPHHTGLFFTYGTEGEVNGNNYWANQQGSSKIKHVAVSRKTTDSDQAVLGITAHWIDRNGELVMEEDRTMIFTGNDVTNIIDFTIRLKAITEDVVFKDTKEGMFGLRVADWLSENHGSGLYLNSSGDTTEAGVWGKRAAWVWLEGSFEGNPIGIIIMNHPSSVNFPTFWHARGYGLFSANPLGQSVFQKGLGVENPESLNFVIKSGETALFKFRMIIYEEDLNVDQLNAAFNEYSN